MRKRTLFAVNARNRSTKSDVIWELSNRTIPIFAQAPRQLHAFVGRKLEPPFPVRRIRFGMRTVNAPDHPGSLRCHVHNFSTLDSCARDGTLTPSGLSPRPAGC